MFSTVYHGHIMANNKNGRTVLDTIKRTNIALTLLLLWFGAAATQAAPVVTVSYSHRQVAHLHVDPNIPEGCIIASFTSEEPAQVVSPVEGFETLDSNHWRFIFTWDHTADLIVLFTDASAETTTRCSTFMYVNW